MTSDIYPILAAVEAKLGVPRGSKEQREQWNADAVAYGTQLVAMASTPAGRYLAAMLRAFDGAAARDNTGKVVYATVRSVRRDDSKADRVLVTLTTWRESENMWIDEDARTDWLGEGQTSGRMVANAARVLVGHRVRAYIEFTDRENTENGKGYRTVVHIDDLGADDHFDPDAPHKTFVYKAKR